ncbi:prephenate dehydrogenase [Micrococcoides hystricis]|uniref:Prephenate dehydrogenase n=1 Tax=Micrococcoides hystricis TaxID=1572761 RepID=A0ABV6P6P0_9MICC
MAKHTADSLGGAVLIRGTGLLGTSIGLGLSKAGAQVYLSDPSPSAQAVAVDIGAGAPLGEATTDPAVVVIAAPPDVCAAEIADALQRYPNAVVLDIASIKVALLEDLQKRVAAGELTAEQLSRYIGCHPMAGRERSGPVAARGELFTSMPWVICRRADVQEAAVNAALEIAHTLGASVSYMDTADHDASVALISHLPQIAASLVASRLQDTRPESLALAGNGLRDVTRIAASDPSLWVQILSGNAPRIVEILYGVREDLNRLINTMENPTGPGARLDIAQLMSEGNTGHARIPGKHGAPPQAFTKVTVIVDDTPGQIAALLADIGRIGINVEDLRMEHSAGHQVGMVEVAVVPGVRDTLIESLTEIGWKVVQ